MTGQDFHDDRSRFYFERSRFSWRQATNFLIVPGVTQRNEVFIAVFQTII